MLAAAAAPAAWQSSLPCGRLVARQPVGGEAQRLIAEVKISQRPPGRIVDADAACSSLVQGGGSRRAEGIVQIRYVRSRRSGPIFLENAVYVSFHGSPAQSQFASNFLI